MEDVHLSSAAVLLIGTLLTTLTGTVTFLFKLLLKSKDDQYIDIRKERDTYRNMAMEAIGMLEDSVNLSRQHNEQPAYVPADVESKEVSDLKKRLQSAAVQLPVTPEEVKQIPPKKKLGF